VAAKAFGAEFTLMNLRVLFLTGLLSLPVSASASCASSPVLSEGYRQMYNLQFDEAHKTFQTWQQTQSGDPVGASADAAAYLFGELARLGILQSEIFIEDKSHKRNVQPDPSAQKNFESSIQKSELLADRALMDSPRDEGALLAKVMNLSLRANHAMLIEKRQLASLSYMKNARTLAEKLLSIDSACYDAYLAIGIENYALGVYAAPVRWMLKVYGAQTNKSDGVAKLELAAEKGNYLAAYARLMVAITAMRDNDKARARELLEALTHDFPKNNLYMKELARLD
jgi:hypothetical protein